MNRSFAFFFLVACGGTTTTSTSETLPGQPPPRPGADEVVPASTDTSTFAVDHLFLGDRTQSVDALNASAWKSFGYDLDHKTTTKDSTNVCTLQAGAPRVNQADGKDGIDDAFGLDILPLVETGLSLQLPSDAISSAYAVRQSTLQIQVTGMPADETASAIGLRARTSVGADVSANGDPEWPSIEGTQADFSSAYVNRGTFVSGSGNAPVRIDFPLRFLVSLEIQDAVITFTRSGNDVIEGTIAGVLDATVFGEAVRDFALRVAPDFCTDTSSPFSVDGIVAQVRQAADMQVDGSNEPGSTCAGISIGLQFTAHRVANPTTSVAAAPQTPPCN